jgi:addiction module HigA family antidote
LLEEFLKPMGISQNGIARAIGVPPSRINEAVHGKRSLTADRAERLTLYFATSEQFWTGLQSDNDLEEARHNSGIEILGWKSFFRIDQVCLFVPYSHQMPRF